MRQFADVCFRTAAQKTQELGRLVTCVGVLALFVALVGSGTASAGVAQAASPNDTQTAPPSVMQSAPQVTPQATPEYGDRDVQVYLDDLPVAFSISPFLQNATTMVPLRALSEALGFTVTWDESGTVLCDNGKTGVNLRLGDPSVEVDGVTVILPQPPSLAGDNTVVPLRFFSEAMGFDVDWDPETYTAWVSSPRSKMQIWGFYALGSSEYSSWDDLFGQKYPYPLEVGPESPASHTAGAILGWFALDDKGRMTSDGPSEFSRPDGWQAVMMRLRMGGSKAVAMCFADNGGGRLSNLLDDPVQRQKLAMSVASSAAGFDGAALDFEGLGLDPEKREKDAANFTAFVDALTAYLGDLPLTVVLPPLNGSYLGYDHRRIGELADSVILMAYGYEEPVKPSPTAPWARVDEAIRLELEKVPAEKLLLGVPAYGTVYAVTPDSTSKVSLPAAKDSLNGHGTKVYDPSLTSDYSTWEDGETTYHAYTESNRTLAARVSLAERHGLSGVAIWRLGLLQEGWLNEVLETVEPLR